MRILQLRAARGWTLERTARVFLFDLHTLQLRMRRIDEQGDRARASPGANLALDVSYVAGKHLPVISLR
jgi:hypothetical protein